MNFSADIIVIGGGWAGFAAAIEAHLQGHSVILVEKAPGATALSSGAIDVAGFEHLSLEKNLQEIIHHEKEHPYSLMARQMSLGGFLDFLRESIVQSTRFFPIRWVGDLEKNRLQISSFGNLKATALVPENMEDANILSMNQAKLLIVGIKGFAPFQSTFIKNSLLEFQSEQAVPYVQFAGNLDLEVPGLEGKSSLIDLEIAQSLDQESCFVPFAQSLLSYLQGKVYTHVIFPPLLGVVNTPLILNTLKRITGLKIAETLGVPITIPAIRLRNAMRQALESNGIQIVRGEVKSVIQQEMCVQALEVESNQNIIRLQAKGYVLASGKYLGGGIQSIPYFEETVFDSSLNVESEKQASALTESDILRSQKLWKVGIASQGLFQPVLKSDTKTYQNVFAAGSVLGGYDYIHGKCGAGVAISTGVFAGRNASRWIQEALKKS